MKFKYLTMILIVVSILISSCDKENKLINPSSDEYLIDKTISTGSTEQIVESGTEFKMIFPANSVKGDLTLKINKEVSYPTFNIPKAKLSSNTYRIKISGNTAFASPVKIIINYDKSQIPEGKTAAEIIQAYIYANGNWKIATYQLDEPNSKIIISISNLKTPKANKDNPELQVDGDLVIGSGQKILGQDDISGTDRTIIEKTITPSKTEQIIKSSDGIRIIIPAGALNTNLEIKLVKLANPPKLNNTNMILGTNIFEITLSEAMNFNSDIQLRVKYDKSKIHSGFTDFTGVKGLVYVANLWFEADYEIDNQNEEIVFFVHPSGGKQSKDKDMFLESPVIIFGDAYSIPDLSQDYEFLEKIQKSFNISIDFSGYHTGINNGEFSEIHIPSYFDMGSEKFISPLVWNENAFIVITTKTMITGTIDSKNKTLSLTALTEESKLNESLVKISCELNLLNVPFDYDSMISGYIFRVRGGGQDVKNVVKSIIYTKTIYDKNKQDQIIEQTEYKGTDFSKNAWVEIEMMHK